MGKRIFVALALAAVAASGGPKEVRAAVAKLKSRDAKERRQGAKELERLGPEAAGAAARLVKLLDDEDLLVRHAVQAALIGIGPAAVPRLVGGLRHRDAHVRATVCGLLRNRKLVESAKPYARRMAFVLSDRDANVRSAGVKLLRSLRSAGVKPALSKLKDSRAEVREAAIQVLSIGVPDSVPLLRDALLESKSTRERLALCVVLGRIGGRAAPAAEALVAALDDDEIEVRIEAIRALGLIRAAYAQAKAVLLAGLTADSAPMRQACLDALAAYDREAIPDLVAHIDSAVPAARARAIEALFLMEHLPATLLSEAFPADAAHVGRIDLLLRFAGWVPREQSLPALLKCLTAKDAAVRRPAADALGRMVAPGDETAVAALVAAAKDDDAGVRAAALASLGRIGGAGVIEVVRAARSDEDARVRMAARFARWALGDDASDALTELREGLAEPGTCLAAAHTLAEMRVAAEPAVPELVKLLGAEAPAHRRAAADALGRIVRPGRGSVASRRGTWRGNMAAELQEAIERGLAWLAKTQDAETGRWDCAKYGGGPYDPGVTGLALWAMLGAGDTQSPQVRRGLDYLLAVQRPDGGYAARTAHSFLCCDAIAGIAMAEAWLIGGDPRYLHSVERAVQVAEVARNPGFGWRYKIRGGENDTHMTTWMVTLLRLAEMGGVAVDRNAYAGARLWLDKMTDPNFGWVGYNFPGGVAARPQGRNDLFPPENTQSMTAAGIWCSHLLGGEMLTHVICRRGIELCEEVPPERDRKHRDQYYFQFGALAMFHADSGKWPAWESALEETYLALQEEDGSWPADGVWGSYGGSVYSTSMAVLALLTPYRYPRGFASSPELQPSVRDAVEALEKAAKDDDATVAAAAELALRRITRE